MSNLWALTLEDVPGLTLDDAQRALELTQQEDGKEKRLYHQASKIAKALREHIKALEVVADEPPPVVEWPEKTVPHKSGAITGREFLYRCLERLAASEEGRKDFHWIWSGLRKPYQAFVVLNEILAEMGTETPGSLPSMNELKRDRSTGERLSSTTSNPPSAPRGPTPPPPPQLDDNIYDELRRERGGSRAMDGSEGYTEVAVPRIGG